MTSGEGTRARGPVRALASVTGLCAVASYSGWMALVVFAFGRGGAGEAGIVAATVLLPAVLLAPAGAALGSGHRPHRLLMATCAALAASHVVTAWGMWQGNAGVAYVGAAVLTVLLTMPRRIAHELLPSIARSPHDLVVASAAITSVVQLGRFLGPLGAGFVLVWWSPGAVFAAGAVCCAVAAAAALTLAPPAHPSEDVPHDAHTASARQVLLDGMRALVSSVASRWIVATMAIGAMTNGAVDVLAVTLVDERSGAGSSATGWLMAAYGFGALLGGMSGARLVGGRRMTTPLLAAGLLSGVPLVLLAAPLGIVPAAVLLAVGGAGAALSWLIGLVALQRHQSSASLTAVLGVVESVELGAVALGSVAVARLVSGVSLTAALVVTGAATVGVAAVVLLRLRDLGVLDEPPPAVIFRRLAGDPVFASIDLPALERLARGTEEQVVRRDDVLTREGEPGDGYYLLVSGAVDVRVHGVVRRQMGAGESFGEIALLHDGVRTATVTALDEVTVLRVRRDAFLQALGVNTRSRNTAHLIAQGYLTDDALSATPRRAPQ